MTITVRLYRHSDLDLMLLCNAYGKRFARFVAECIRSYIRKTPPFLAGVPDIVFIKDHENIVSSKYVGVSFSPEEDADILVFLKENIRYGYRNNFIKNILRFYAGSACIAAYCSTEEGCNYLKNQNTSPVQTTIAVTPKIIPTFNVPKKKSVRPPASAPKPRKLLNVSSEPAESSVEPQYNSTFSSVIPTDNSSSSLPERNNVSDKDEMDVFKKFVSMI